VVIVTLLLVVFFAMLVLVVDVGGLLLAKVGAQNSADSAALAAAISCGKQEGVTQADLHASHYTDMNLTGSSIAAGFPSYSPNCDAPSGRVTVVVEIDRAVQFAPVLGFGNTSPVRARATAIWGGAGAGEHVAPLMLSSRRLGDCEIPPDNPEVVPEQECTFWWNNSPGGADDPDLANAEWGSLDLLKWDVVGTGMGIESCDNSTPPQFEEWMLTGFFDPLPINFPEPTYVCRGQGNFGAALDNIIRDAIAQELNLFFPVNDQETQVDRVGDVCSPTIFATTNCTVDKYNIVGFARLRITALYRGNRPEAAEFCGHVPEFDNDANARCMVTVWTDYSSAGLNPEGGQNFGVVPVKLIE
jgi:hypothetical protein